jgi:hypothetical protein
MGSKAVRFFQNITKVITYTPHMTCSPGNTIKKYDRGGKISLAIRIKASVDIVTLDTKDLAGCLQQSIKKRPPKRPFGIVTTISDKTEFQNIG